jgi:septum formation protein
MKPVCLASGSPRRRALLAWCGIPVSVAPQGIDERRQPDHDPITHARRLAGEKARSALDAGCGPVVVAADTVVHLGDRIFDKPRDRAEARAHLAALSGRTHQVTTGVCVVAPGESPAPFAITTTVRFRALDPAAIERYVATGEADDKAGAYAIQGQGGAFVAEIHGSWTNVMGLPVEATLAALATRGIPEPP